MNFIPAVALATLPLLPLILALADSPVPASVDLNQSEPEAPGPCVAADLEAAFPAFRFERPVLITSAGDGSLYMALGDGGSGGDPKGNGQNLSTWLASILRINVEEEGYSVPDDNPFLDVPGARPEIWAFGLRNVWRFSFDRVTGKLWAGDVGQNKAEEVSIIERGGNYGWKRCEAFEPFSDEPLSRGEHIEPIASYGRLEGISITGGVVYRGERIPGLQGAYLYAYYVTGNMWSIREKDGSILPRATPPLTCATERRWRALG